MLLGNPAQAVEAPSQAWPTSISGTGGNVGNTRTFNWQSSPYGNPGVSATQTITSRVAAQGACAFMGAAGTGAGINSAPNVLTFIEPDFPANALLASNCITASNGFVSSFVFNKPLIAPIFHFYNLDASRFAITGTSTTSAAIGLTTIVKNNLLDVSGTTLNNTVQAANALGCNNNTAGDTGNGACGSFRVTAASGLIRTLTLNNNATPPIGASNDGFNWTVSFPTAPLTKQFIPASILLGQTSQLAFSITNPNQSASVTLTPLDFTDNLPAGVTVASATATNNGSCGSPAVSNGSGGALAVGATSVRATNISVAPGATCTIRFTVTAPTGSYTNSTSNMSSSVGNLIPSGSTTLTVTPQPAFTCDASMYLSQDSPTALYRFDTSSNPFVVTPVGPTSATTYNTTAFNPGDNYLYAIAGSDSHLLRIGNDGSVVDLGVVTGLPHVAGFEYNAGEFAPDGSYYVRLNTSNNNQIYRVNPVSKTASLITLNASITVADLAWHNGLLYATDSATGTINLVSINPLSGAVTVIGPVGLAGASFGAMFGASNGVYGGNNAGGFYRFDLTTGAATLISDLPGSGRNDGAKCPTSALTFPADLAISKDDGSTTYTPGNNVTYSIVVSNAGPFGVQNAVVSDALPTGVTTANWTCTTTTGGGTCGAASGTGAINSTASLPVGASVTYSLTLFVPSTFSGNLVNTATVTAPAGTTDSNTGNNSATDTDSQFPLPPPNVANLSCSSDASLLNTAYDGTGGKLTSGNDAHWQVALTTTPITGTPPAGLSYNTATVVANPPGLYMVSPYDNANWISHAADALHPTNANYDIFYRYQLNLGPGTDPATLAPRLDFYSDNSVIQIWINGVAQNIQSSYGAADPYFYAGFTAANPAAGTLTGPWNSGFNEIVVHVKSGPGAQAFLAQVVLPQSICQPATVTLNKTTRLISGGPFAFGLTNTGQATGSVSTTAVDTPTQVDGDSNSGGSVEPFAVTAFGTDVVITENALPTGWLLSDAVCTSGGTPVGSRSDSAYTIPGGLIDASAESFECTFTNTPTTSLSIDKTVNPTTARAGDTVSYAIAVNNDGPGPGDGAVVADPPVPGVYCAAATLTCSASGGAVCPASLEVTELQGTGLVIPTFPAGGSLQFGMACTVTATGQ